MSDRRATVYVRLKDGVLDPQGVTIRKALEQMGFGQITSVRSGKFYEVTLNEDGASVERTVDEISRKLLVNPVTEKFDIEVES